MQCIKPPSKQFLLEQFYNKREKWLSLYCQDFKHLRHLGVNCFKEKVYPLGNGYLLPDYSTRVRQLNAIKQGKGKIQFATNILNDYGKIQGSPGGFGSSPKNRF